MQSLFLAVDKESDLKLFWGVKPSKETYQKCFEGGHSAFLLEAVDKLSNEQDEIDLYLCEEADLNYA